MTDLEQALASILESIETARNAGNPLVLAALLQRKSTICAALAASEHSWHMPPVQEPKTARRQSGREEKIVAPLLADACV